jgi:hypothetical protein
VLSRVNLSSRTTFVTLNPEINEVLLAIFLEYGDSSSCIEEVFRQRVNALHAGNKLSAHDANKSVKTFRKGEEQQEV